MKRYLAWVLALGFSACNQTDPTASSAPSTSPQPGQIQLSAQGLSAASLSARDSSSYVINLDTIKSSAQDEFILQNTGDFDVKNIRLTTDNPNFYFSPSTIADLPPSKSSPILQVIKLNVIHGSRLDGIGFDSVLAAGANIANAHIAGSTVNFRGDSLPVSQSVQVKVFAQLVNIAVYDSTTPIDLATSLYGNATTTSDNYPDFRTPNGTLRIVNTGNVPFTVEVFPNTLSPAVFSGVIPCDSGFTVHAPGSFVEIDAGGVTSNPFILPPSTNGKFYAVFD